MALQPYLKALGGLVAAILSALLFERSIGAPRPVDQNSGSSCAKFRVAGLRVNLALGLCYGHHADKRAIYYTSSGYPCGSLDYYLASCYGEINAMLDN